MTIRTLVLASLVLVGPWLATPALAQASLAEPPADAGGTDDPAPSLAGSTTGTMPSAANTPAPAAGTASSAAANTPAAPTSQPANPVSPFERAKKASAAAAMENYRERLVVVYGTEPCPKPTRSDEVVVCARRPAEDQYRIPPALRTEPGTTDKSVPEERAALVAPVGIASGCDATGPNPGPGCTVQGWSDSPRLRDRARLLLEGAQVTRILPDGTEVPY